MERDSGYSFITSQSQSNLSNILNIVLPAGKAKSSVETLFLPPFHTDPCATVVRASDKTEYNKICLNFTKVNNITGWVIFLIATAPYTLTREATASFWD